MKQQPFSTRLLAVLMAMMMVCSVVPATTFTFASAAAVTTSAKASKKISKAKVSYTKTLSYTGKARKPKIVVKYGKKTLKKGTDYTVAYRNNTEIGVGKIIIKAMSDSAYTGSKTVKFKIIPAKVKGVTKKTVTASAVKLGWNAVKGASGYIVYRYDANTEEYTKIKATKKLAMTVKNLTAGKLYRFAVRAYAKTDKKYYGFYSKVLKVKTLANPTPPTPVQPTTQAPTQPTTQPTEPVLPPQTITDLRIMENSGSLVLVWTAVSDATGYEVCLYDEQTKTYTPKQETASNLVTISSWDLKEGDNMFAVRAYRADAAGKLYGDYSNTVNYNRPSLLESPAPGSVAKVTGLKWAVNGRDISFNWNAVEGATGYELAQFDETTQEYQLKAGVVSTSAPLTNLEEGKVYQFAVRAYVLENGEKTYGAYSDPVSITIAASTPTVLAKVENVKAAKNGGEVTLTWNAVPGAEGYEISSIENGKYTKIADVTAASAKLDKLERHKELELAVCAYVKKGTEKNYGPYSEPVKVIVYNADYYGAIFKSGTFRMTMMMDMDGTGEQPMNVAVKNGNMDFSGTMPMSETTKIPMEFRVLNGGKNFYIRLGNGALAAWFDATEMVQEGGEMSDMSSMLDMGNMFSDFYFGDGDDIQMSTETRDGVTYEVETVQSGNQTVKIYTVKNDLRILEVKDQYGTQEMKISNFSGDVSDELFAVPANAGNLKELMDLVTLLGGA